MWKWIVLESLGPRVKTVGLWEGKGRESRQETRSTKAHRKWTCVYVMRRQGDRGRELFCRNPRFSGTSPATLSYRCWAVKHVGAEMFRCSTQIHHNYNAWSIYYSQFGLMCRYLGLHLRWTTSVRFGWEICARCTCLLFPHLQPPSMLITVI